MIKRMIDTAAMRRKADLVLKNGKIVNVFSHEILEGDLAIDNGKIIGIGNYEGEKEVDLKGKYVAPGLIDSHVHIESASTTPLEFARAVLPRGTTTVVADPHEIGNVLGLRGIKYMLDSSKDLPLKCYFMLPSCVPATPFETSGAILHAEELSAMIHNERVLGLGELMNYPGVVAADREIIKKVEMAKAANKFVDGHGPVIKNEELNAYSIVGIRSDHECTNSVEMLNQVRAGMYIAIREGSACKDLLNLIGGVTAQNERRMLFCTDDRHPGDIMHFGHIDNNVRLAIQSGVDPITAIRMATLNTAECYHLTGKGAIAPGYDANFIIVDNLEEFNVLETYVDGTKITDDWHKDIIISDEVSNLARNTIRLPKITAEDLKIPLTSNKVNVIKIIQDQIVTEHVEREVLIEDGFFKRTDDVLHYYVVERHTGSGRIGKGLIEGFGINDGAIALTIAHDSHNIGIISTNEENAYVALEEIKRIGGGAVVVKAGKVIGSVPLCIAGLMSEDKMEDVSKSLRHMYHLTYDELGVDRSIKTLMTLSFMSLPVIPALKLTDLGLFDVMQFKHIPLEVK